MQEIKVEKTIYELLQEVRYELSKTQLKKSGYNAHLKFNYFELGDFLPKATELMYQRGLCPIFNIGFDANGVEMATLTLVKGVEQVPLSIPTADPPNQTGVQAVGAKNTYMRRYLYMNLLDLTENDIVDATAGSEEEPKKEVAEKKATEKQVEMIKGLYSEEMIEEIKTYFKVEKLEDLTLKQASATIAKKRGKNGTN